MIASREYAQKPSRRRSVFDAVGGNLSEHARLDEVDIVAALEDFETSRRDAAALYTSMRWIGAAHGKPALLEPCDDTLHGLG